MDEDDGQIARELVPVDEAFMMQDDDEEGGATLGLEQKCNFFLTTTASCGSGGNPGSGAIPWPNNKGGGLGFLV